MTDERDDMIILVDETGEEIEVEHIDTIEMGDNQYVVLLPKNGFEYDDDDSEYDDDDDDDDGDGNDYDDNDDNDDSDDGDGGGCECGCDDCEEEEVVILKVEINEDGEETLVAIEDEAEQEAVFEIFTKRMEESECDDIDI